MYVFAMFDIKLCFSSAWEEGFRVRNWHVRASFVTSQAKTNLSVEAACLEQLIF